jgi:hypothetical protein
MWSPDPAQAEACIGSGEGSDHFRSYVRNLTRHFCKRLLSRLEPLTSWSQGKSFEKEILSLTQIH